MFGAKTFQVGLEGVVHDFPDGPVVRRSCEGGCRIAEVVERVWRQVKGGANAWHGM